MSSGKQQLAKIWIEAPNHIVLDGKAGVPRSRDVLPGEITVPVHFCRGTLIYAP